MHRRRKVDEKSCVTFLLCDPGWYIQRTFDVQNKWEENTYIMSNTAYPTELYYFIYIVANPTTRGLLNRHGKENKRKSTV